MAEGVEKYSYLWDGSQNGWKLIREADFPGELFIVNRETGSLLHIDDPVLKAALSAQMLKAGIEVEEAS